MSNKKQQIPSIRFNGFTDAWEQRKLEEVSKVYDGTHQTPNYTDSGIMFLSVENIKTLNSKKFISEEAFEKDFKIHPQKGDILMTRIGDIGTANVVQSDEPVAYYVSLALLKPIGIESNFLATSIATPFVQDGLWRRTLHIAFPKKINKNEIAKVEINIPSLKEQIKIGAFFKQLDNTIALHQRQLDNYKELKKAMLQKMFPQDGEKVPKIRFDGFTKEWEQRKLGDCFAERNERISEGELISVTINSGVVKASSLDRKDNSSEDKSKYKKVEIGDIAYNSMRMWQGASGVSRYSGILSPAYTVIIPKKQISSVFFSYLFKLNKMIQIFQANSQGLTSDTWNLKYPVLKDIKVYVPNYEEQNKIGNFFKQVDDTIAFHQQKVNDYQQVKKAMIQRMFV